MSLYKPVENNPPPLLVQVDPVRRYSLAELRHLLLTLNSYAEYCLTTEGNPGWNQAPRVEQLVEQIKDVAREQHGLSI